ncbi:MAG: transglycosylase SLT domain-containing protein [Deltaproteobacteria bacterium]|nr:transglycosylase SLT domain-containing protein [Deltaproteobacteria bacterium]
MSNAAVRRLDRDIAKLKSAQSKEHQDNAALSYDTKSVKSDQKLIKREHDQFEKNGKALAADEKQLAKLTASEQSALAPLQAQQAQLQAAYDASVDPTTGLGDPAIQAQLAGVEGQEAAVQAKFDPKIQSEQADEAKLQAALSRGRADLRGLRADLKTERKAAQHETRAVKADTQHVKNDRKVALKDLQPAEYKLGLQGTNKRREELGLKKVGQVIRPGVPNVVGGQVGKWIAEAQTILKQHGVPLSKMNAHDIDIIIMHESSGNPNAVNNWDSNAAAGHPSEGLMQTIGPTFNSYKLPGHGQILNPVDNIIAGVRYAISRYGSISNVPGVRAVHAGGSYVGY